MRFPRIRLVEETEQKFRRFEINPILKNLTMPKFVKGDPLSLLKNQYVAKYQKKLRRTTFIDRKKYSKKVSQCRQKIKRGDPLVSSGFANARKSFWLQRGPKPATAGFPLNLCTKK